MISIITISFSRAIAGLGPGQKGGSLSFKLRNYLGNRDMRLSFLPEQHVCKFAKSPDVGFLLPFSRNGFPPLRRGKLGGGPVRTPAQFQWANGAFYP